MSERKEYQPESPLDRIAQELKKEGNDPQKVEVAKSLLQQAIDKATHETHFYYENKKTELFRQLGRESKSVEITNLANETANEIFKKYTKIIVASFLNRFSEVSNNEAVSFLEPFLPTLLEHIKSMAERAEKNL